MPRLLIPDAALASAAPAAEEPQPQTSALLRSYGSAERYLTSPADWLACLRGAGHQPQHGQHATAFAAHAAVLSQLQRATPRLRHGMQLLVEIQGTRLLPFGVVCLDNLLLGGIREASLTEVAGETCSGKTQLCHQVAAMTALRGERVLYVDASNAFSPARARQLLGPESAALAQQALGNITVLRCHSIHALLASLDELAHQAPANDPSTWPKLLVIDSISALLSPVIGNQQHNQGHVLVAETARLLRAVADSLRAAVLLTNHVVGAGGGFGAGSREQQDAGSRPGPAGTSVAYKPALGEQWRGVAHARLQLSCVLGTPFVCATLLSHALAAPGQQAWFQISDQLSDAQRPGA